MQTARATVDGITMTLSIPDDLEARPARDGLSIRRRGAEGARRIYEMTVTLHGSSGPPSERMALDQMRGQGADAIRYGLQRDDGGSGGEEVTLIATRACAGRTVRLRFDAQAEEGGDVDLEPAFAVLESARCTEAG